MVKGDEISGMVNAVRDPKQTKKGQAYTPICVDGKWLCILGTHGADLVGKQTTVEVTWVAPDGGAIFVSMAGPARPPAPVQAELPATKEYPIGSPSRVVMARIALEEGHRLVEQARTIITELEQEEAVKEGIPPGISF